MNDPTNPFQNRNELKDHFEAERIQKHIDEAIANAGGDLCRLLEIAAASSSDELADDEHLAQNVLVLCERAATAIKSLQKRSLMFLREREEARANAAAEKKRADDNYASLTRHWLNESKLREALKPFAEALPPGVGEDRPDSSRAGGDWYCDITWGDLRRAHAAHKETEN